MPKWCSKFLQLRVSTLVFYILCLFAVIELFIHHGQYNYSHIATEDIPQELLIAVNPNLKVHKAKDACQYIDILKNKKILNPWEIPKENNDFLATGIMNGSYVPENCHPQISVAILITYRNRQSQLDILLPYIHNFLKKQNIHYRIYLIEQQDEKPFNKGLLYNIGARQAIADKFPCLILHDVDLFPLAESNLYACTKHARHMSASIDKFRYVLTYDYLVGGVLAIPSDIYVKVNGFSNMYVGWGGEDDDMAFRLEAHKQSVLRFPREMSLYTMLVHKPETRNSQRTTLMQQGQVRMERDGYNTIQYSTMHVTNNRLFTLIGVKLI